MSSPMMSERLAYDIDQEYKLCIRPHFLLLLPEHIAKRKIPAIFIDGKECNSDQAKFPLRYCHLSNAMNTYSSNKLLKNE